MDDSERSYGYSKDIYHGSQGVGGHYDPGHRGVDAGRYYPGAPHFDGSYESAGEGDPAAEGEPSPEEAAMHVVEAREVPADGTEPDAGRHSSNSRVESFTWQD